MGNEDNEKEKGFFERIKETLFGEEKETPLEEYKEELAMADDDALLEEIEKEAETGQLHQQKQDGISEIKKDTQEQETKKGEQTQNIQKQSVQEMEADPENKPIVEVLKTVIDPELQIDIWTLGLIYNIDNKEAEKEISIRMTFTSVMCPVGPMIVENVRHALKRLPNVENVKVEVVFNPPWEPTDELREMLGV